MTTLFDRSCLPGGAAGRAVYNLLSGYAHAREWSLLTSSLQRLGDIPPGGVGRGRVTANDDRAVTMTFIALRLVEGGIAEFEGYVTARA